MAPTRSASGTRKDVSTTRPSPSPPPRVKKPRRAETRPCPVCSEQIPVRLLAAHAELEMRRVEDIVRRIGDAEELAQVDDLEDGLGANKRRSALKARQSLTAHRPSHRILLSSSAPSITIFADTATTATTVEYAIGRIIRRRKARQVRFKELAKEEATWLTRNGAGDVCPEGQTTGVDCPVCSQTVRGDRDVIDAHVDACLAHESRRAEVERQLQMTIAPTRRNEDAVVDIDTEWDTAGDGSDRARIITNAGLRGTGIHIRPSTTDIDDDIDIDGTDDAVFGDAQFEEADVMRAGSEVNADVQLVEGDGQRTNHERQAQDATSAGVGSWSKTLCLDEDMDRLDMTILTARLRGDSVALIAALEAKLNAIPAPSTCRVCLSVYVDPTVSTGCWHTCCATCWLRCLGATKLCPMCQRITGASELRRVYL